jgi:hypothetical protein
VREAQDKLNAPELNHLSGPEKEQHVKHILQRLPRRVLDQVTTDVALPPTTAAIFASHMLQRWGVECLVRDAKTSRAGIWKWRRVTALRVLVASSVEDIFELLQLALQDSDRDVVDAAVSILGRMPQPRAAEMLIDALRNGQSSPLRIASQLDRTQNDISQLLLPLLQQPDGTLRRWGSTLLSRYRGAHIASQVTLMVRDEDSDVRGAAALSLSFICNADAAPTIAHLVYDEAWFVRANAARALGRFGNSRMAGHLTHLLTDAQWWVRLAARESLLTLCKIDDLAWRQLVPVLDSPDRFARNGAAEVLQNLGVVDAVLRQVIAEPRNVKAARRLCQLFHAGGHLMVDKAMERVAPHMLAELHDLLANAEATANTPFTPMPDDLLSKDVIKLDVPLTVPQELAPSRFPMSSTRPVSE